MHAAFSKIVSSSTPYLVIDFSIDADRVDEAPVGGKEL